MDLETELLKEASKRQALKIANIIGDDQEQFAKLIMIFLNGTYRLTQRAAWVLSICVDAHPGLLDSHLKAIVENLEKPDLHDAVKRNTVRFLQNIEIPEDLMGTVANVCFEYLGSNEPVAIKVFDKVIFKLPV